MNILPTTPPGHKIAYKLTGNEVLLIDALRAHPEMHAEPVTHAERNLIAMIRSGKGEIAASTARELANMAGDYAAYQERCDADEALGFRDAS